MGHGAAGRAATGRWLQRDEAVLLVTSLGRRVAGAACHSRQPSPREHSPFPNSAAVCVCAQAAADAAIASPGDQGWQGAATTHYFGGSV